MSKPHRVNKLDIQLIQRTAESLPQMDTCSYWWYPPRSIYGSDEIVDDWRVPSPMLPFFTRIRVPISLSETPAYRVYEDDIVLPPWWCFDNINQYHRACAHEHIHWTGPRLDREMGSFDLEKAFIEECIAEIGGAIICRRLGINVSNEDVAGYLAFWARRRGLSLKLIRKVKVKDIVAAVDYLWKRGNKNERSKF